MMMFGLFCLIKIFRFFLGKALICRYRSLPQAKQDTKQIRLGEAKEDIKVLWSELDLNLLGDILGRLTSPTDQARFRAVCKTWLAVHPVVNTTLLPWFVRYDRQITSLTGRLELSLYEPSSALKPTSVHTISLTKLGIPTPRSWLDIKATCINNWLFFSTRVLVTRPLRYRRNFILFSPFTKKFIKLPQSDYPLPFEFRRAFSTDPNSPDCVFLLSDTICLESRKIAILTYRNGDKEWTARQFNKVDEFVPCRCFPIYFQGIFYLVSPLGQIASYNILNEELRFENLAIDIHFSQNTRSHMKYEVFKLNGNLMLIYFGSYRNDNLPAGNPCIKRFDWSSKLWMPVSSLGDHSLFVADRFCAVATIKVRINEVLRNKIYHVSASGCMIYYSEDSEHKYFNSNFSYPNSTNYCIANRGHRFLWLDSLLGYGDRRRYIIDSFWLKPPIVIYRNKMR